MAKTQQPSNHIWTFLPGLHGTCELFEQIRENISKNQPCEWVNLPGHSQQDYGTLSRWIDQELVQHQNQKRILIAESFSGPLALKLASLRPQEITGVVLAASFCDAPINPSIALLPLRPLFMMKPPRKALKHFLIGPDAAEADITQLSKTVQSIHSSILSQRVRAILELEEKESPQLKGLPMLILQAQNDNLIPWEAQQRLEARYPNARVHWIESPHLILQRHPKSCLAKITDFASSLQP